MQLHNVAMVQGSHHTRFAREAGDEAGVVLQIGVQELDGDKALQVGVESLPDLGHASSAQKLAQFVFSKTSRTCAHVDLMLA
jgi:hypothetical protein